MKPFTTASVIALALASLSAQAAQEPLWELGAGLGGLRLPHYRGSDQYHDLVLPVPYAIYRGKIFRATRDGARAVLLDSERVDLDLSLAATAPARSKDNLARAGMPDLPPTLELGPKLNVVLGRGRAEQLDWKLDFRLPVRGVVQLNSSFKDVGWTVSPVLNLDLKWQGWNLGAQAGPLWASRRYNAQYYDVAAPYATATRPAYAAPAGNGGWNWTTAASRRLGAFWVGAYVRGDQLQGAAFVDSPLVKKTRTVSFGLAFSWVFAVSDERVSTDE
jgi:outer membrane scaffolding protein for murein synthesis (MipA/OmpV family)